jgi:hypothetical protein
MTLIISSSQHGAGKVISILQTPTHIYATQHSIIITNQPTMQMGVIISSPVIPAICSIEMHIYGCPFHRRPKRSNPDLGYHSCMQVATIKKHFEATICVSVSGQRQGQRTGLYLSIYIYIKIYNSKITRQELVKHES